MITLRFKGSLDNLTVKKWYENLTKSKAWKPRWICRMVDQQQRISSPFILSFQNLLQKVTDKSLLTCGEGSDVDLAEKNVSPFRNSKHVEIPKKRNDTMGAKIFRKSH